MIGFLNGNLIQKRPPFLLLDVGGVGYELEAPMTTFYDLPDDGAVSLFVHLVVREDAQLLFGFAAQRERELFRNLLRVNGVGPRVALAILSTLRADQFTDCVQREDSAALARVPGIGKKTAERIILDLRDRVDDLVGDAGADAGASPVQDAVSALIALGYRVADANRAVRAVEGDGGERESLIKNALQHLTKR